MAREIAFIDPGIPDLDTFIAGLRPEIEAIVLSPSPLAPAPDQMAATLRGRRGIDAIHIVAHGTPGAVCFTSGPLTLETISEHAASLAQIGDVLSPASQLLLWSCRSGSGKAGAAFIDALEHAVGAPVAATGGLVGSAVQGGSWRLDGAGTPAAPLTPRAVGEYSGLLVSVSWGTSNPTYTENNPVGILVFANVSINTPLPSEEVTSITIAILNYNHTETLLAPGGSFNSTTGVLTITAAAGSSDAVWASRINSVTYTNPTNDNPFPSRSLNITINSGGLLAGTDVEFGSKTITITRVNDAPTATIALPAYTVTEQTSLNLKGTGLSIADVDANNGTMTATLSVTEGTLTAVSDGSVSVSGSGTSSVTITGTLTNINAFLGAAGASVLTYANNSDAPPASVTLTLDVSDGGNTGTGGTLTGSDTAIINITPVNDQPTAAGDFAAVNKYATVTGNVIAGAGTGGQDTDPDLDTLSVSAIVGLAVGAPTATAFGTLTLNADGSFSYVANRAEDVAVGTTVFDNVVYTVSDGHGGTDTATLTFAVTGVGTGNSANNRLLGNEAANTLSGLGGNDHLEGRGGSDTLIGGAGRDFQDGGAGNDIFLIAGADGIGDTFSGGSGSDTLKVTGPGSATLSDFNAAASLVEKWVGNGKGLLGTSAANKLDFSKLASKSGLPFVDGKAGNDALSGSKFNDDLRGGDGNDILKGNAGNDELTGGRGRDTMTGGAGADDFNFTALNEMGKTSATRDRITDFTHGVDDIDLSAIDANGSAAGNAAFTFLAAKGAAFTGIKGQLHWLQSGANTLIEGDTNGDGKADFQIELTGLKTLSSADFIL